jgi:hypothetical protein
LRLRIGHSFSRSRFPFFLVFFSHPLDHFPKAASQQLGSCARESELRPGHLNRIGASIVARLKQNPSALQFWQERKKRISLRESIELDG